MSGQEDDLFKRFLNIQSETCTPARSPAASPSFETLLRPPRPDSITSAYNGHQALLPSFALKTREDLDMLPDLESILDTETISSLSSRATSTASKAASTISEPTSIDEILGNTTFGGPDITVKMDEIHPRSLSVSDTVLDIEPLEVLDGLAELEPSVSEGAPAETTNGLKKSQRGAKACARCRRQKMRCIPGISPNGLPCQRCSKHNANCVFTDTPYATLAAQDKKEKEKERLLQDSNGPKKRRLSNTRRPVGRPVGSKLQPRSVSPTSQDSSENESINVNTNPPPEQNPPTLNSTIDTPYAADQTNESTELSQLFNLLKVINSAGIDLTTINLPDLGAGLKTLGGLGGLRGLQQRQLQQAAELKRRKNIVTANSTNPNSATPGFENLSALLGMGSPSDITEKNTPSIKTENVIPGDTPAIIDLSTLATTIEGFPELSDSLFSSGESMDIDPIPALVALSSSKEITFPLDDASLLATTSPQTHTSLFSLAASPSNIGAPLARTTSTETTRKRSIDMVVDDSILPYNALGIDLTSPLVKPTASLSTVPALSNQHGPVSDILSNQMITDVWTEFFRVINPCWSLLDPQYHTIEFLSRKSHFLLLVLCTLTCRYYTPAQQYYPKLAQNARELAASVVIDGQRSVETVQACLLLGLWGGLSPVPSAMDDKAQSKDIGWLLISFASRLAVDLGMGRPRVWSCKEEGSTEASNRIRTWMFCYALERSNSLQRGKKPTITSPPTQILQISLAVCIENPKLIGIGGYCELQVLASEALQRLQTDLLDVNFGSVTSEFEAKVSEWNERLRGFLTRPRSVSSMPPEQISYYRGAFDFFQNFWSLVIFSFGLQHSLDTDSTDVAYYFFKCATYANNLIQDATKRLAKHVYFKHAPDTRFVLLTYAAVMLVKFSRPEFQQFCPKGSELSGAAIGSKVLALADVLENVAVDSTHMPSMCASFLRSLLLQTTQSGMTVSLNDTELEKVTRARLSASRLQKVAPLVATVIDPANWQSMVVPGFESRDRPSAGNFLRTGLI